MPGLISKNKEQYGELAENTIVIHIFSQQCCDLDQMSKVTFVT